jgi:hypothetical protein
VQGVQGVQGRMQDEVGGKHKAEDGGVGWRQRCRARHGGVGQGVRCRA